MKNEPFVAKNRTYLSLIPFEQLNDRLIVGFSTRENGYSIEPYASLNLGLHVADEDQLVIANRQLLAKELNMPLNNWVFPEQVHGNEVQKVTAKDCGAGTLQLKTALSGCDGLYTCEANVMLASLYADCVPLYFYSPVGQMVGLAHAGWKGTVAGIGVKLVQRWYEEEQIPIESIYVAIGPSISEENYEVDHFIITKINELIPNSEGLVYKRISDSKYLVDLKKVNKQLLIRAGIKEEQIFLSDYCTYKDKQLFYSYRRQRQTGRMTSFIGIKDKEDTSVDS